MWTTVMIWYVYYNKIIVNTLPYQVFNKNIIISIISVFVFVDDIIIFLKISKYIVLFIQFTSVIAWDAVFLFIIFGIVVCCF